MRRLRAVFLITKPGNFRQRQRVAGVPVSRPVPIVMGYTWGMSDATLEWITRLVSIDTTSEGSNRELIDLVARHARDLGLDPHVRPAPDQESKANLVVTVPDRHGGTAGGVVISGHTDVVPTSGQRWTSDPFAPQVRDGALFGRGTCDMKGYLGAAIAALPAFIGAKLSEPVHLALSYDEEIGCGGGRQMVKDLADLGLSPRLCIVGEPTSMQVVAAHKSMTVMRIVLSGVAAHSSLTPSGVNAIEYGARLITYARDRAQSWRERGPFDPLYAVPYTTCSVNTISGGIAQNTVPDHCEILLEFRAVAADDPQEIIADLHGAAREVERDMQAANPRAHIELEVLSDVPGLDSDPNGSAHRFAVAALGGAAQDPIKVTYGTEAGIFAASGIDTIVCGPGDIAQAHTADEYVELEQIEACERFFAAIIDDLSD